MAEPRHLKFLILWVASTLWASLPVQAQSQLQSPVPINAGYSLVINNGRVLDPASGRDEAISIGIKGGRILAMSKEPLVGEEVIDAEGHMVAPGFIDLHTHSPFPFGQLLQTKDGVTTALDLEAGAFPVDLYGEFIKGNAYGNYGASVGHYAIRIRAIEGKDQHYLFTGEGQIVPGKAFTQQATEAQIEEMRELLQEGLDNGGLGIGLLLDYMSEAVSDAELRMIFEVAKANNTIIFAHIRRGVNGDIQPLMDFLPLSQEMGVSVHICHINANAMGAIGEWLEAIDEANAKGADISAEIYPYTAGSTSIQAQVFSRDWRKIFNIDYGDVQWADTGEWFTEESWSRIRKERPDSSVIHHYMKEEWLVEGMRWPEMIIATDAMPAISSAVKAVPNVSGSFTRVLAKYVREDGALELMDALKRMSYFPAERLASIAPAFKRKGRIQKGADADLVIFKLENLQDMAKYTDPFRESSGWDWIIVGGDVVVRAGDPTGHTPGTPIYSTTP